MPGTRAISLSLLALSVVALSLAASAEDGPDAPRTWSVRRPPGVRLGATIVPRELGDISPEHALADAKAFGLEIIRTGVYWSEVQPDEKTPPDFSKTLAFVQAAERAGLEVVLTVGMKAPRWPEFYIPRWAEPSAADDEVSRSKKLRARTLAFVERAVVAFRGVRAIKYWQVENEPMDRAGESGYGPRFLGFFGRHERRWIGADFLKEEVAKVRSLDGRPIVVNFWSEDERASSAPWTESDYAKKNALALGDVIGLDVYPSTGGAADFASDRVVAIPRAWLGRARAAGKEAWIIEAQAEPWGSYTPDAAAISRLLEIEAGLGYRTIFLWGFEWMLKKKQTVGFTGALGR